MSHRKKYENNWGKIPKGYEVHHLDFDHENNEPENLLAIPRKMHRKYHFAHNFIKGDKSIEDIDRMVRNNSLGPYIKYLKQYQRFAMLLGACCIYRNQLAMHPKAYKEKVEELFEK